MLSEYEQNLIKEKEGPGSLSSGGRRRSKWSLVRQQSSFLGMISPSVFLQHPIINISVSHGEGPIESLGRKDNRRNSREMPTFRSAAWKLLPGTNRNITTIEEASV